MAKHKSFGNRSPKSTGAKIPFGNRSMAHKPAFGTSKKGSKPAFGNKGQPRSPVPFGRDPSPSVSFGNRTMQSEPHDPRSEVRRGIQ